MAAPRGRGRGPWRGPRRPRFATRSLTRPPRPTPRPAAGNRDYVVVGSDSGRIVILLFDPKTQTFERVHQETYGKTGCRRIVPGQYLAADPKGRAIMIGARRAAPAAAPEARPRGVQPGLQPSPRSLALTLPPPATRGPAPQPPWRNRSSST